MSEHDLQVKLDRVLERLDQMAGQVAQHEKALYGEDGEFGLVHQMRVMWRAHIWVLCTASAAAGSVGTAAIMWVIGQK